MRKRPKLVGEFSEKFFFLLFLCYNSRGGRETFAAVRPKIHRDNQFTPSQIYASVYTQEKFTLKFYLINTIIEDKKIDVDSAPERILEKENAGLRGVFFTSFTLVD